MKIKHLALVTLFLSAFAGFGQLKFNEFSFANTSAKPVDPLSPTKYEGSPDWVEIYYNQISPLTYSITGWYLSDDRNDLRKYQIPYYPIAPYNALKVDTHQVFVVYLCEHDKAVAPAAGSNSVIPTMNVDLHANFSINQTKPGTWLYLTPNNSSYPKDSIDVYRYKNKPGHSWGRAQRKPNLPYYWAPHWTTASNWRLYSTPTPGAVNPDTTVGVPAAWYYDYCPVSKVDFSPGFYNNVSSMSITVTDTLEGITTSQWYIKNAMTNTVSGTQGYSNIEIYGTNDCTDPVVSPTNLIGSAGTSGTPLTGNMPLSNPALSPVVMARVMLHDANIPQRFLDGFEFYGAYMEDTLRTNHTKMSITCVCVDTNKLFITMANDSLPMLIDHFDVAGKEAFRNHGQGHRAKIDFFNPLGVQRKMWQFVFRSEDEYGYNYTNKTQFYKDPLLGYSARTDFPEVLFRSAAEENFKFPGIVAPTSGFLPTHIRDFFNHTMVLRHKLRFDASHYVPTYMVVNGFPRGIYYVKETIDTLFTNEYYARRRSAILKNNGGPPGTVACTSVPTATTQWSWFYNWAMNSGTNVHIPTLYYRISDSLDFNSFNDYMIYNMYSVNSDFVKRYAMWWKGLPNDTADHRSSERKWRFALTNTDFTWGYDAINNVGLGNTGPNTEPCDFMNAAGLFWPSYGNNAGNAAAPLMPLWFKLMANDTFKSEFITRYADLLNTALSCDSLKDHLKYVRQQLTANDMAGHVWYNMGDAAGTCIGCDSVSYWNDQLDSMAIFIAERCTLVNQGLTNCFPEISGPYNFCVDVDPVNSGYVDFNSLTLKNFVWNGKYFDSIINVIKAHPYQNYVFDHWETSTYSLSPSKTSDSATFYIPADGCIKAIFKLRPAYETYGEPMLPTGFSPNADGNNDVLNVYGIADASSYELEVYNRWGEQIFHSVDKTEGWNGKFNGTDVPAGVYAYRYNIIMNGKTYKSKGNVTLVR